MTTQTWRRWLRVMAVGAWLVSVSIFVVQVWVLLDPSAESIRLAFPAWPHDPEYDGYLRGIAWADVLFMQPLFFLAGIGLWRMQRWGLVAGVGVGAGGTYFSILQIAAQVIIGGEYSLFGMGTIGAPLERAGIGFIADWAGILPFAIFPAVMGVVCAVLLIVGGQSGVKHEPTSGN